MNRIALWLNVGAVSAAVLFAGKDGSGTRPVSSQESAKPASHCATPEYRQFDFWVGDWDAYEAGNPVPTARLQVRLILDGCVLLEDYQDTGGHKGQSFSIYDASRKVWHQSWVTNRGELVIIEGTMQEVGMVLSGADRTAQGEERKVRGTWTPVENGVRETAVTSTDGGKTWKLWFDILFRPHKK